MQILQVKTSTDFNESQVPTGKLLVWAEVIDGRATFHCKDENGDIQTIGGTSGGGGGLTIVKVTGVTRTIESGKAYVANNDSQVVFTLPADIADSHFVIVGSGAGGFKIVSNANATSQKIRYGELESVASSTSADSLAIGASFSYIEFRGIDSTELVASIFADVTMLEAPKGFSYGKNRIEALNFATETNASITRTVGTNASNGAGFNSAEKGYVGFSNGAGAAFHKFNFSTEVNAVFGSWNGTHYGMSAGSNISLGKGIYINRTAAAKIVYATDAISTIASGFPDHFQGGGGCSSPTHLYAMGKISNTTAVDKINFSTEAQSEVTATITSASGMGSGGGNENNGYARITSTTLNKIVYATEAITSVNARLESSQWGAAVTNSTNKLYIHGGSDTIVIRSMTFAVEEINSLAASLGGEQKDSAGFQSGGII